MPQVARIGDADTNHPPCAAGQCATGSPNVFAEGLPVGRIGDPIAGCTSVAEGSPDVFANGGSGPEDNTRESLVPDDGSNYGEGGA